MQTYDAWKFNLDQKPTNCDSNSIYFTGNGEIDFQEFMVAASVTSHGTPLEKLRWAFHMYDTDKDGLVTYDEAYKLLSVSLLLFNIVFIC